VEHRFCRFSRLTKVTLLLQEEARGEADSEARVPKDQDLQTLSLEMD